MEETASISYGTGSAFPNQTFNSSNYWVDVVFEAGPAPTLNTIAVAPVNPSINTGATQQFTATGTYSDGSTQNLTSQATWTSSNTSVATVNAAGLASGTAPGSTTITAAFSGKTGIATLTVQAAPLTITTGSLPNGVLNSAYSATAGGKWWHAPLRVVASERKPATWFELEHERNDQWNPYGGGLLQLYGAPDRSSGSNGHQSPKYHNLLGSASHSLAKQCSAGRGGQRAG